MGTLTARGAEVTYKAALKKAQAEKGAEYAPKAFYVGDGDGLWLQLTDGGKSWVLRYQFDGRSREMGLGSYTLLGLAEARDEARKYRRMARIEGVDPIEFRETQRRERRIAQALEKARAMSFKQAAQALIKTKSAGWKSEKHGAQWPATLEAYVYPLIGDLPVKDIDTALVMKVLEQPIGKGGATLWTAKTETAGRIRGRMEAVLDWAKVRGHRDGENPARWRGHLEHQLAAKSKVRPVKHHARLPHVELFAFWSDLKTKDSMSAEALRFTILTAARSGEAIGAQWSEIDLANKLWTIPAERMKAGREHRVPLSDAAVEVLVRLAPLKANGKSFVFPSRKEGAPLSGMAMLMLLRGMGHPELTTHGFRSTFSDWAAESTAYPTEMVEMALAHTISNKVEAAYRRGDMFERRRRLMADWATHCETPPAKGDNVHAIGGALRG